MKKEISNKGVYIVCRFCGLEYIEEKNWILDYPSETKCPRCKNKIKL